MKKRKGFTVRIHFTNRWLYTFIAILIIVGVGVGVYATVSSGTAPNPGHTLQSVSPFGPCITGQIIKWNGTDLACASLPGAQWPYLQDIKLTSASHNGDFDGYREMYNWIQSNGCNGYHVCTANEVVNALQGGMSNPLADNSGAWSDTGVAPTYPKGTSSSVIVNDCQGWTYTGDSAMGSTFYRRNYNYGGVLYTGTLPTDVYCSSSYPVLCCK